ncbi:MAG: sugar ABC transporter permease [Bifidobacteriaceae bacterium]|nr:sugar ABC transporter permease [Bifidobacteriaceae bacterium]
MPRTASIARRTPRGRRSPRHPKYRPGEFRVALVFVGPAVLGFTAFYLFPAFRGLYYSFTDYTLLGGAQWIGGENYAHLVTDDVFWNALWVTFQYVVVNIGTQTIAALFVAVLMQRLTTSLAIRGVLLLPYLIANVVIALVWFWMCNELIGIVNVLLERSGFDSQAFFGSPTLSIITVALVNTWRHVGYTALLIFAGLQTIPPQLYEAAAIDGSGEIRSFFKITLPLLRPVLALVMVVSITGSFQVFDTVSVTTRGGPGNATRVIYYYIYEMAFSRNHFGYGLAMAVALFILLAAVAYIQLRLMRSDQSDLD